MVELQFHSKDVSDFQMSRLVRASLRKYSVPITAFVSDALIADDTCLGVSFDHSEQDEAYHRADGSILRTGKIRSARKEGRFWLLETQDGNYVIASFKRGLGRASFQASRIRRPFLDNGEKSTFSSRDRARHMTEERWSVARATTHFGELLDHVIMTRKPVFIEGERRTAVLISMVEWESIQAKLISRAPSDL